MENRDYHRGSIGNYIFDNERPIRSDRSIVSRNLHVVTMIMPNYILCTWTGLENYFSFDSTSQVDVNVLHSASFKRFCSTLYANFFNNIPGNFLVRTNLFYDACLPSFYPLYPVRIEDSCNTPLYIVLHLIIILTIAEGNETIFRRRDNAFTFHALEC